MTDFEGKKTVGFEGGAGLGDEATVDFEARRAGEEGGGGLVVADLWVEVRGVAVGDVRRVADDGVEGLAGLAFRGEG